MKRYAVFFILFTFLFSVFCTIKVQAQVPQLFNYQGIARDAKGNPFSTKQLSLKISILPAADALLPEYEETQLVSTNEFGLYTLQIGNGTAISGQMKMVKWETGNKYIRVAIDPAGGTQFVNAGTSQLLSVPYAIYADKSGSTASGDTNKTRTGTVSSNAAHFAGDVDYVTKFTAFNTIGKSQLFDNGNSVGIGTTLPAAGTKLHLLSTVGNIEHIRMQNTNPTGFGKFIMYNDNPARYATFTKYGTAFPGGVSGVGSQYPFANMLAFGNNLGPLLISNSGNIGFGIVTGGTTKLYFNARQATGYLGLGGSSIPSANVHFNNSSTGDTLKITNATTGHLATDGLEIRNTGNAAAIINRENSTLSLGTNNSSSINITSAGNTEFNGSVKISSLNGSVKRPVFADSTGKLVVDSFTSFSASAATGLPQSIPDNSCTVSSSSITVSGSPFSIPSKNITVELSIDHTFVGDLEIYLCSPIGDTLELTNDQGGTGDNFENTIFTDLADSSIGIAAANAPFSNMYKPTGSVLPNLCGMTGTTSTFSGIGGGSIIPNGVWTLIVRDGAGADVGSFKSWSISFNGVHFDNYLPKWKAGSLTATSLIFDNGNAVGVGTINPKAKLHVNKDLLVTGIKDVGDTVIIKGIGSRMFFNSRKAAFRAGGITIINQNWDNLNIGDWSAAFGLNTKASEICAFATGNNTQAMGNAASSFGTLTKANGGSSSAFGRSSISNGFASLVVGQFNDTIVAAQTSMQPTTPLFIVGNGTDAANRNNVLVVRNDGRVGIGTDNPGAKVHIAGDLRIGSLETLADSGANLLSCNSAFIPTSDNQFSQSLGTSSHRWSTVFAGNGVINTSDARDKTDIAEIPYGLNALKQLKPVHFRWKQNTEAGFKLGFLAQDLKTVLPEVVSDKEFVITNELTGEGAWRETKRMGVYYSDIIPVLTKAMQEQQTMIETQQQKIEDLLKRLEALEKK